MRLRWLMVPAILLSVAPAWADDTVDPYAEEEVKPLTWKERQARQTMLKAAEDAVAKEDWKAAERALDQVPRLMGDAESLLWLGYAVEKQGKLVKAKGLYQRAQSISGRAKNIDLNSRATTALGELSKRIPHLKVVTKLNVPASVLVDDEAVTVPQEGIEIDPGKHTVEVRANERKPYRVAVVAVEGGIHVVEASLPLLLPPAPPAPPPMPPDANGCAGCAVPKEGSSDLAWPAAAASLSLIAWRRRRKSRHRSF